MNTALAGEFNETLKPDLMQLQQLEEGRIGFQKFCLDKYIQTLTTISQTITHVTQQCHTENDAITQVDTLNTFVKLNKSKREMPASIDMEVYQTSAELTKYRNELEQRYSLQSKESGAEIDEESMQKRVLTPEEKVRKLLYQLLIEIGWSQITADERQYLVESVRLSEIRGIVSDFMASFNQPRKMQNDCFYTLGSMCNAMIDEI